jgi:hypothetical protein
MCSWTEKLRRENKSFKVTKGKSVTNLSLVIWKYKRYCVSDTKTRQQSDNTVWPYERKKWEILSKNMLDWWPSGRRFGIWNWRGRIRCGKWVQLVFYNGQEAAADSQVSHWQVMALAHTRQQVRQCRLFSYTVRSESRCALTKTRSSIERTIVTKNLIKQLRTLPVLHFNRCLTTEYSETIAHFNDSFDTDNQVYIPYTKCTATFLKHCI